MIALTVHDPNEQHFVVRADEPMRIEILVVHGRVIAHVYRGAVDDMDQEPEGAFDGTLANHELTDWRIDESPSPLTGEVRRDK